MDLTRRNETDAVRREIGSLNKSVVALWPRIASPDSHTDLKNLIVVRKRDVQQYRQNRRESIVEQRPKFLDDFVRHILQLPEKVPYVIATSLSSGVESGRFCVTGAQYEWRAASIADVVCSIARTAAAISITGSLYHRMVGSAPSDIESLPDDIDFVYRASDSDTDYFNRIVGSTGEPKWKSGRMEELANKYYFEFIRDDSIPLSFLWSLGYDPDPSAEWNASDPEGFLIAAKILGPN